jgi:cyclopropane fatty-acyl-phospholipid synthase-like methyltransferase
MKTINYPPDSLIKLVGSPTLEAYLAMGNRYAKTLFEGLYSDNSKILDAGCGSGRIARHLADHLDETAGGVYHGFDIVSAAIDWCNENISSVYNNFNFKHIDIKNDHFNPTGSIESLENVILDDLNYKENYFDFIFAASLFTHLQKEELESYLKQLYVIAKPGCKLYLTFFTCDSIETFESLIHPNDHEYFQASDVSYVADKSNPTGLVIYKLNYLKAIFNHVGFKVLDIPDTCWQTGILLEKI